MNAMESNTRLRGETSRPPATRDWIKAQARMKPAKVVARLTGLSVKGVEKIRAGDNSIGSEPLAAWCGRDPELLAKFVAHCCGVNESDPEFQIELSRFISAVQRRA